MRHVAVLFDAVSSGWSDAIVRASWQGALALLAAMALCRLFRKLPARIHCWIWRCAILKLLLALFLSTTIPLRILPAPHSPASELHGSPAGGSGIVQTGEPAVDLDSPPLERSSARADPISPLATLLVLWALGIVICLANLVGQWRWTVRLRQTARLIEDTPLLKAYHRLAAEFTAHCPALLHSPEVRTPLLTGILAPVIILPSAALMTPAARLRLLLAHELAHLRRRDLAWNWLFALTQALFFFHPLIYMARRQWRMTQELAADALAIAATRAAPADYAKTLLDAVPSLPGQRPSLLAVGVVESYSTLERRLIAMRHARPFTRRAALLAAASLGFFASLTLIPWQVTAQQSARAPGVSTEDPSPPGAARAETDADAPAGRAGAFPSSEAAVAGRRDGGIMGIISAPKVELRAHLEGVVREISIKEGERVKRGQILLRFDDTQQRIHLEQARAKVSSAKASFEHARKMREEEGGPAEEVQKAESAMRHADAELQLADQQLGASRLTTPFDGVISELSATEGQFVSKGTSLAIVVAVDSPRLHFHVPQDLIPRISPGQKVRVVLSGLDENVVAEIDFISPELDPQTRTLLVKAKLEPNKLLRPGTFVTVVLTPDANRPRN